jgi:activator of HSP90 ATPase
MAKVGEGDERWIVKEREDGANVNGWHWSEKNLTEWAKERLTELLSDIVVLDDSTGSCKVCKVEKMTGDVTVQARKQKKFPLYELEITLNWEGQLFDAEGKSKVDAKGKVKIPDLSEETYDDLEMTVTLEEESDAKRALKEAVRLKGAPLIRNACMAFVKELKASVGEGKEMTAKRPPAAERANNTYVTSSAEKSKTSQVKISYDFVPPPQVLYDTLLDTNRIKGCTASDAAMSREVGGKFSMFSGAVNGENVELRPFSEATGDALIKWKWRFSTWQPEHYSTVIITLTDKDGSTKLELLQTGVPEEERERTEKGWKGMLFDRMKAMLGGSVMG